MGHKHLACHLLATLCFWTATIRPGNELYYSLHDPTDGSDDLDEGQSTRQDHQLVHARVYLFDPSLHFAHLSLRNRLPLHQQTNLREQPRPDQIIPKHGRLH